MDVKTQNGFIQVPKMLLGENYSKLKLDTKLLYCIFLDRLSLSIKNKWIDENENPYIYYTIDELKNICCCGKDKIESMIKSLENNNLIKRLRQGQGKPSKIYVNKVCEFTEILTAENQYSRMRKNRSLDCGNSAGNNTDINNTDINNTYLSFYGRYDGMKNQIKENIEYKILTETNKDDISVIDAIVDLITDTIVGDTDKITIGNKIYPKNVVAEKLLNLENEHICFVIDNFKNVKITVKNVNRYLLTMLFNAQTSMTLSTENLIQSTYFTA